MKSNYHNHHAPYLRNSKVYDHDFWCTCVKWWYLQAFFFHFLDKRAKTAQNENNNYICHASYLRTVKHIMVLRAIVLNDDISRHCFHFFGIFMFWAVKGVRGQKIIHNEKYQFYLSCAISQEQYSLWSWFLVHLCQMMISQGVFFIFLIFSFFRLLEVRKGKK